MTYVRGQLLDLPRKSIEPIALANEVKPRTLQEFLGTDVWDEQQMRDRLQQLVARDHLQHDSIGIVDDSGHAKCGSHTACVSRQYSGRAGKVDNCVVTVNLSLASFDTRLRVMLDSVPYLPESWDQDQARRRQAHIPDEVRYRPKYDIALEELDRARIEIDALLAVYNIPRISQVQLIYRARLAAPDIAPGPESAEVGLFAWADIPWDELAFPSVRWALGRSR